MGLGRTEVGWVGEGRRKERRRAEMGLTRGKAGGLSQGQHMTFLAEI